MGMKGMTGIIAAIMVLVIVALIIFSTQTTLFFESGIKKDADIQATLYTMRNALEAAWLYESISVDYSAYQACYDLLRQGGSMAGGYWSDSVPARDGFARDLSGLMQRYVNRYTATTYDFLDEYSVRSPQYDALPNIVLSQVDVGILGMSLHAQGSNKMQVENDIDDFNEKVVIRKTYSEDKSYDIPCLGLFVWGTNEHDGIMSAISEQVENEMAAWPAGGTVSFTASCSENLEDMIFYETAKNMIRDTQADVIRLAGLPEWYNSTAETEELLDRLLTSKINDAINQLNSEALLYEILPDAQVTVEITPNCQKDQTGSACTHTCSLFEYRVEVDAKTAIGERDGSYYPVSKGKYPEFDTMKLIIPDRVVYGR